ncbi:prepilin-type N-terminal cleavage/methylation domain-containing protein [Hassallia byssoidea VB512170]|uniref:Prepilin-type N-terminal cleavage/methylation domain-containing protein n=1 Tax=Hassallia byssoidea VB512170 TaxID=1304833 RepID=A0A846HE72_9CYAN|nr:hormogonium polysaccharide secretion pseudopilin HpsC [Hassalia byssoidea]NEU75353.1 prepilin-type N-terminal cleavage/methylation domain-containing protein [Hassalia byssoidea VB512170]
MSLLKRVLINQLIISKTKQKNDGFTLIELLVAMILAFLVITPLLGFMINVLDNDRKEQAKVNSEQEIKTALDYIKRDLEQAVYIYDADGINAIRQQLPKNTTDDKNKFFPVLVFWKRQFIPNGLPVNDTAGSQLDDTFVYSLVAYYLIKDDNLTWSKAARIGRFQISDGYGITDANKNETRDDGFKKFELKDSGNLKSKMNQWTKDTTKTYKQDVLPLIDYIDQTPISTDKNPQPTDCPTPLTATPPPSIQMVPQFTGSGDAVATGNVKTRGFYVCVDSSNTVVQVYLRGNAIARLQQNDLDYTNERKERESYYPQASVRVQGRGFVFTK